MKHWLSAFRLRTLPLAVSSILVGSALAYAHDSFTWPIFLLALLTAILLQVLSNLSNDLGDHQHGTDNPERIGPQRTVQSGAISPAAMKRAMILCGLLAFTSGVTLITVALGFSTRTLVFLLLGLAAIGAAVKYTFGRNPYGYAGLGDVSVFLFFGIIGVCGTFYLHAQAFEPMTLLPACSIGLLSAAVLNVNNMRDITNDAAGGKRTLVVRMGSRAAKTYHIVLLFVGAGALVLYTVLEFKSWWQYLFVLGFHMLDRHFRAIRSTSEPAALDPQLKILALGTFLTAVTFSLGLILA